MNSFSLSVLAVEQVYYQGAAVACTVGTTTGSRTFEAHHEGFVSVLVRGAIHIVEEGGGRLSIEVEDGLVRFDSNSCVMMVTPKGFSETS
jgi:F0F1-type ATP synthase epsilon subunit